LSYATVGELLLDLKEESSRGDNKMMKVAVVATTRHSRTNDLTTSKALSRAIK